MNLQVTGMEEIEITDPAGVCHQPAPEVLPLGHPWRVGEPRSKADRAGIIPGIYIHRNNDTDNQLGSRTKWGLGSATIQEAGRQLEDKKWEENWQRINGN